MIPTFASTCIQNAESKVHSSTDILNKFEVDESALQQYSCLPTSIEFALWWIREVLGSVLPYLDDSSKSDVMVSLL